MDLKPSPDNPSITHKVKFNVRMSRADGTFYVRDDPEGVIPSPDNQVFTGSVTLGLFGTHAPNHVKRFLDYVDVKYSPADDTPVPTYARSQFPSLDQSTGLLTGGVIPGLAFLTAFWLCTGNAVNEGIVLGNTKRSDLLFNERIPQVARFIFCELALSLLVFCCIHTFQLKISDFQIFSFKCNIQFCQNSYL